MPLHDSASMCTWVVACACSVVAQHSRLHMRPRRAGLMAKVPASGAGDSRFESWAGHSLLCNQKPCIKFNT